MVVKMSLADVIDKNSGYIPLWRDGWEDWDWYYDDVTKKVYDYCYRHAGYKARNYKGTMLKKGSFVTSRSQMAKELRVSEQNIRTAIKHLISTNDITIQSTRKGTIITVENYDWLVNVNQQSNFKLTNSQPTANQQVTTNNKDNKENKEKNVVVGADPTTSYTNDFLKFWNMYLKKREKYKCDTFKVWIEKKYTSQEVSEILDGARMYSDEMKGDKHMVYARSFLEDEIWKRYLKNNDEIKKQEIAKRDQEQMEYFKQMGVVKK